MGVTIHYRGTIDNAGLIETFEDRVLDLACAMGGRATIWRSFSDDDPSRMIRGLILEMAPGQESMSLLISPEGQLINLFEIETAEKQPLDELPYCFVKTQFGSIQGHIAIVHLLSAMKSNFFSDLDVEDESGYYEHRDADILRQKIEQLNAAIASIADGLNKYGLSPEALEDPKILASRIERVAMLVHQKLGGGENDPGGNLLEVLSLQEAMEDRGNDLPTTKLNTNTPVEKATSIESTFWDVVTRGMLDIVGGLVQATSDVGENQSDADAWREDSSDSDQTSKSLTIVQLKRALRGHSFARGGVFGLAANREIDQPTADRFHDSLKTILNGIQDELMLAWN